MGQDKRVTRDPFAALPQRYSEREICEIVRLVSSNHLMNTNKRGVLSNYWLSSRPSANSITSVWVR